MGGLFVSRNLLLRQIKSSEFLCLVSSNDLSMQSLINVGRHVFRLWTELNANGCGVQPLSLASFTSFSLHKNSLPKDLSLAHIAMIEDVYSELKKAFKLQSPNVPVWLFRTGGVNSPPNSIRAPRIDIDDALMDLTYDA